MANANNHPTPIVVGPELVLRVPTDADLDGMIELCRDPEMVRWTTVPVPYERVHAEEFLHRVGAGWADGTMATFAIELRGRYAGNLDLRMEEANWASVGSGWPSGPVGST